MDMKKYMTLPILALLTLVTCTPGGSSANASNEDSSATISTLSSTIPADGVKEADAVLPASAKLADETEKNALYLNVEEEATEDVLANKVTVWLRDKATGQVRLLLTTNPMADLRWEDMVDNHAVDVGLDQIAAADNAFFVPWDESKILVQGCPDARNIWTYIVDTKQKSAMQFPAKEGLFNFDQDNHRLILLDYKYHIENGRYSVAQTYTMDGAFVSERIFDESELN